MRRLKSRLIAIILIATSLFLVSCSRGKGIEIAVEFPADTEGIVWFAEDGFIADGKTVSIDVDSYEGTLILKKADDEQGEYIKEKVAGGATLKVACEPDTQYRIGLVNDGVKGDYKILIKNASLVEGEELKSLERNAIISEYMLMKELVPTADFFEPYIGEMVSSEDGKAAVTNVYRANNNSGVVVAVVTPSFGGPLSELVGFDEKSEITGVRIISHADTPGVMPDDSFLDQYVGLSAVDESIESQSEIDFVSGATVSCRSMHLGVYLAIQQVSLLK